MIWRFLAVLVLGYLAAKVISGLLRYLRSSWSRQSEVAQKYENRIQEMVKDPVCGMFVPGRDALSMVVEGVPVYFCSERCRRKFVEGVR